jgi:hypothetical protein
MRDDALPIGRLVLAGVGVLATVAIAVGVVLAMLGHRHVPVGGLAIDRPVQPGHGLPALQAAPQPDLASYRADKRLALDAADGTGAADLAPIDTAMARSAASAASSGAPR